MCSCCFLSLIDVSTFGIGMPGIFWELVSISVVFNRSTFLILNTFIKNYCTRFCLFGFRYQALFESFSSVQLGVRPKGGDFGPVTPPCSPLTTRRLPARVVTSKQANSARCHLGSWRMFVRCIPIDPLKGPPWRNIGEEDP